MFIQVDKSGYTREGAPFTHGYFLIMAVEEGCTMAQLHDIRCFIRYTKFGQCGNFMMGFAFMDKQKITLSGTYGNDGLTKDLPKEIWEKGVPLPKDLYELWKHGEGWNGAGAEGPSILAWAKQNFTALKKAGRNENRNS